MAGTQNRSSSVYTIIAIISTSVLFMTLLLWIARKQDSVKSSCNPAKSISLAFNKCPACPACTPKVNLLLDDTTCPTLAPCKSCPSKESFDETRWVDNWDNREKTQNKNVERVIYLVTHGEYNESTGKLTDRGKQQMNLTARRLIESWPLFKTIITSPISWTRESADIIQNYQTGVSINEENLLTFHNTSLTDTEERDHRKQIEHYANAFKKLIHRPDPKETNTYGEVIVGHGDMLRYFLFRALQFPTEGRSRVVIPNASITKMFLSSAGRVHTVRSLDAGHLPTSLITTQGSLVTR